MALDHLLSALERDADAKAEAELAAARAEAARLESETAADLARRRDALVAAREAELHAATERAVAEVRRRTRQAVLEARQRFLDRVFEAAATLLRQATGDPAFLARLPEYLNQARAYLGHGRVTARCRPDIAGRVRALAGRDGGITVVEDPAADTGIRLAAEDGIVEVDNTLEARLARLQPRLALEVLRRLEEGA